MGWKIDGIYHVGWILSSDHLRREDDKMSKIDGNTLRRWGFEPGRWFGQALEHAKKMEILGATEAEIYDYVKTMKPSKKIEILTNPIPYGVFIEAETDDEVENVESVHRTMGVLMKTPTIKSGAVMPDACPAGTIPVGAIVATENAIHPGFHSADICCSMAMTTFKHGVNPTILLDAAEKITHFGPFSSKASHENEDLNKLLSQFENNSFLKNLESYGKEHFMTQGDGNHFLFVGQRRSDGRTTIVTHHGSRGLGAQLYKRAMLIAKKETKKIADKIPENNSWIVANSQLGRDYWKALQVVRLWTKMNHFAIHDSIIKKLGNKIEDRFWNEHNFVFQKSDGLFYHAKGATPSYRGFSPDDDGRTLIPMNMREPILISSHKHNKSALEFAPHGAGRNMSRTKFLQSNRPDFPNGIDVRFYCGKADRSELPEAYKDSETVRRQIDKYDLAKIEDYIDPYGSIMAGDWESDAPWKKKKKR